MKIIGLLLLLLGGISWLSACEDDDRFLWAIRQIETQDNHGAIGLKGERGAYQFMRTVWAQHTRAGFRGAHSPELAHAVAHQHLQWLKAALVAEGIRDPNAWYLAAAWNAGVRAVSTGRITGRTEDYASRVINTIEMAGARAAKDIPVVFTLRECDQGSPFSAAWFRATFAADGLAIAFSVPRRGRE